MESEKKDEIKTVTYYGKKVYSINSMLARKKLVIEKAPDYRDGESEFRRPT